MYYFYCPKCGNEMEVNKIPRGCVPNIRDGFGMPIYHYRCDRCSNLDAGYMTERDGSEEEKYYYKHVISLYQNVRGLDKAE
jgi:hypothetical protein